VCFTRAFALFACVGRKSARLLLDICAIADR
jgi:hypothetical protein